MAEIWKDITGYKGYYKVSNRGLMDMKVADAIWRDTEV